MEIYQREPDKSRYLDAVGHIRNSEVPFYETEVHFSIVNKILGKSYSGIRSYELPGDDYIEFIKRTSMDMAYIHVPWKLGRKEVVDGSGIASYSGGTIRDYDDIKNIEKPNLDKIKRRIDEIYKAKKDHNIGIIYRLYNVPSLVTTAIGYERYFIYLLEKPDFIKDFQKKIEEYVIKQTEIVLSYPVDAVMLGNYLCMNTGPMISPKIMEEFEFPYLNKLTDMAHKANKVVEYHVDGNYTSLYPKLIEIGIDAVHAIQNCEGRHDIFKLNKLYGDKIAFHGDIDVDKYLIKSSEKEIENEVNRHIDELSKDGGYICSSSHDINKNVSINNFMAMINAICNY